MSNRIDLKKILVCLNCVLSHIIYIFYVIYYLYVYFYDIYIHAVMDKYIRVFFLFYILATNNQVNIN
jgi:hypothetical protein